MQKTIIASIISLTGNKKELLEHDYNNYQWWMIFGIDNGILSGFKSYKHFKQKEIKYKEYPLPLHQRFVNQWLKVRKRKLTQYWIKIPNSKKKGQGIWLPLKFHQPLPKKYKLKDSFLIRKGDKYYIHFCVDIPEPPVYSPKNVLAIDLGIKNPVTMVNMKTKETQFLGKEMKRTRGKYFYLRKKLGSKKKPEIIRKIGRKEKRKINNELHHLSKNIVNQARKSKSALVIGKLKNLPKNKGRKFNRKLSTFSHFKLCTYIQYKAQERGVPVIFVNEAWTSRTCHACGMQGTRTKNWFICENGNCEYKDNADRNAAFNIGKRGLGYMPGSGVEASARSLSFVKNEEASTMSFPAT